MKLQDGIERLLVATVADGRSPRTVGDYRQRLSGLADFLGHDTDVASIDGHDLRRYVADLRGRETRYQSHGYRPAMAGPLSPATIAGHIRAIKRLFGFLESDGVIDDNPATVLKVKKAGKGKEPKAASLDDFLQLLHATEGSEPAKVRDRAILLFLADTAARVGGLVGLALADLDLDGLTAWVTEKGNKRRAVFLSDDTAAALAAWLLVRPAGQSEAVFTTLTPEPGQPLTTLGVSEILRRLKKRAGVTGPCNPHAFRHAFAREYLRNGGDLATLSDLLGHSDISVTAMSYAIFLPNELQDRHARYSPVANLARKGEL